MHSYVVEYLNENEFKKIERSLKKYNMLAYKKLIFDYVPSLRDGNFQGVVVSKNSKEGIVKYELKLPTDRMFSKVHGDIVLHYTLYENQKCLASLQEEGNRKQSEYAIVYLQKLLQENHLKMSDFDEMVITIGPGSYTGVRVALTIAKTLNATMNIKVKTVSSLKAMAGMKKAISILDARSHKLFLGIYNEGKVIVDDCLINMRIFVAIY